MKFFGWFFLALAAALPAQDSPPPSIQPGDLSVLSRLLKKGTDTAVAKLAESTLGKDGGDRFFYVPTRTLTKTPAAYQLRFEDVTFKTSDGIPLNGWFLRAAGPKAKGTIVFSHGNAGSMSYHIGFVNWLVAAGYNVLMYDYRGYGKSAGEISRAGLVRDVEAAFAYVRTRPDVDPTRLISFGHSLGGAKSLAAVSRAQIPGLRAVITDSAFASYQAMAQRFGGSVGKTLVSDDLSPIGMVANLKVPLLMVHGTNDEVIPLEQGRQLFAAATGDKTLLVVPGGRHHDSLARNGGEYRQKVLAWLEQKLR